MTEIPIYENQRRVIHVDISEGGFFEKLIKAHGEYFSNKDNRMDFSMQNSATHLFKKVSEARYFCQLLENLNISYSSHPAKDYNKVATQDMDAFGRALYLSI